MKKPVKKALIISLLIFFAFSFACTKKEPQKEMGNTATTKEKAATKTNNGSQDKIVEQAGTANQDAQEQLKDILSKPKKTDNYYFEYVVTGENNEAASYKMWVKGKKLRMDLAAGEAVGAAIFIDDEKGVFYSYDKEQNKAMKLNTQPSNSNSTPFSYLDTLDKANFNSFKKDKEMDIDGNKCSVYLFQSQESKVVIYVSKEYGIVLKYEVYSDNNLMSSIYFKDFKAGNVTDKMVTLPEGANIVDMNLNQ